MAQNLFGDGTSGAGGIGSVGPSAQHGSSEQWNGNTVGGTFGISQPGTPSGSRASTPTRSNRSFRSPSPRAGGGQRRSRDSPDRERSRERRYGTPPRRDDDDQELPTSWGARTLSAEVKINELTRKFQAFQESLEQTLVPRMNALDGRITQLETTVPERFHRIEERQEFAVRTLNEITQNFYARLAEIERTIANLSNHNPNPNPTTANSQNHGTTPQFGQPTNTPAAQQCYIGSPLSAPPNPTVPPNSAPTGQGSNATPHVPPNPWGNPHPQVHSAPRGIGQFDPRDWNITGMKVSKSLVPFNGNAETYQTWSNRMKDHFCEKNPDWDCVFKLIESWKVPIQMSQLGVNVIGAHQNVVVDFRWVANHLWTFIGKNVTDSVYYSRTTLTHGEENNGVELWRALYIQNEGGADLAVVGGMNDFHNFPQCEKPENLQTWIGQWQQVRNQFGAGLPEAHLKTMFMNMLPNNVQNDVRSHPELTTLQSIIDHVLKDLGRYNDARIAKLHSNRLRTLLHNGIKSPVHAVVEPTQPGHTTTTDSTSDSSPLNVITSKLDGLIAALNQSNGNRSRAASPNGRGTRANSPGRSSNLARPDPKFEGCWHCKEKGHSRRDCPAFKKILKENGGKVPKEYKGAYERWKLSNKKVAALTLDDDDTSEFDETQPLWALSCKEDNMCGFCDEEDEEFPPLGSISTRHSPITTSNVFSAFQEDDEGDDEESVLAVLKNLTSKVRIGPKPSQKSTKTGMKTQKLDNTKIAHIAAQIRKGEIQLPDLDLENNDEYTAVWALVDSGAGKSCAARDKHFPHVKGENLPSNTRMTTASGEELRSRGVFRVNALSAEGHQISQNFEDTDVEFPIIAVTGLSNEGQKGTEVRFRQGEGTVIDNHTQNRSRFIRRRGVYFMKLLVPRNEGVHDDEGKLSFVRPGHP